MTAFEHELAAHAQALRAVARLLVGDQHADDLVQETSLQVLRRPPPADVTPRSWLLGILRHRAAKLRRGEQRRAARERAHGDAARGVTPDPRELVEHRETAQRLLRALMALPEPYQATLWLRFFQDLPPSAIAERTGVPLATVKSRLQRGLDLLRRDFAGGRDDAECRRALAAAFALEPLAAVTAAATGALLMATILKLGLAGGIAVAVGLFALNSADVPQAPSGAGARTDVAAATGSAPSRAPEVDALASDARTTVPVADAATEPEPVRVRVVDAFDRLPLPHYALWFVGPDREPHPGDVLTTDANGELQLPGLVRSKPATVRLLDDPEQQLRASPVRRIAEDAWPAGALELAVASGPTYHLVFADGAPPEGELTASLAHERDFAHRLATRGEEQRVRPGSPPWVRFDPLIANPSELGAGPWLLSVHSESEHWLAQGPVDTVRGEQRAPVVLRTVECGRIDVHVTVDGRPLGEASSAGKFHTSIYRRGDDGNATGRDHTLQMDPRCPMARVGLLPPGRYRVYVADAHRNVRTHDVEVRARETSEVTADFPSRHDLAELRVVVRSQSGTRDLGCVSVYARRVDNGDMRSGVASAAGSNATAAAPTFTNLDPGEWEIELLPTPNLPPWDATVKRVAANAGTVEFTCLDAGAPPPGYAQVLVVDARGAPVGCAGVTTFVDGQQHYGSNTDGDGKLAIGPYLSGRTVQLLVRAADHRPVFVDVVPTADPQQPQRVELTRGWGTMLVVVEPGPSIVSKPLADVEVLCDGVHTATTDARGLALLASDAAPRRIELRRASYTVDYGSIDASTGAFDGGTQLPFFVVMKPDR